MDKFDNINLGRDSTTPLEHTFGLVRIHAKDVHTIKKFISVVEVMFLESYKKKIEDFEKIKGRSLSFGVTVEDESEKVIEFPSSPQQIAIEFLNLINLDKNEENQGHHNLYNFIEILRDFDEIKKPKLLTINKATLGTAQTKTISQRISFDIEQDKIQFMIFINAELPMQKINKSYIIKFY